MNALQFPRSRHPARRRRRLRDTRPAFSAIRWLLVLVFFAAVVGAATWWLLRPLPYVVDSYIEFEPDRPAPFDSGMPADEFRYRSLRDQHVALLKSARVLEGALSRKDIASSGFAPDVRSGVKWLEDVLEVEPAGDAPVICIRLRAPDSEQAEELVLLLDAVIAQYVNEVVTQSRMADMKRQDALTELIGGLRKDLIEQYAEIEFLEHIGPEPTAEERAKLKVLRGLASAKAEALAGYVTAIAHDFRTAAGVDFTPQ